MDDIKTEYWLKKGYPLSMLNRVVLGGGIYDIPDSWVPVLVKLDADLAKLYPSYTILQVKSKFGGLRYYVSGVISDHPLIQAAEKACSQLQDL